MYRILTVVGTRPEAIKLAPVLRSLADHPRVFETIVGVTGQHRELLQQVLDVFSIRPQFNLSVMKRDQDLSELTALILKEMRNVLSDIRPDLLLIQGDTATVLATALAAFYQGVKIGHVEAGLRTHDMSQPFPEEMHRRLTDHLSELLFAPTEGNRLKLLAEGISDDRIHVTGNTVVDALLHILSRNSYPGVDPLPPGIDRMILLTAHRRENFGRPLQEIYQAIRRLARFYPEIHFVYPVHPNPHVKVPAFKCLSTAQNVHLIRPVDYLSFIRLMERSLFILTDSGGVQEEAPTLKKPVLILRNKTERPELVEAGGAMLVGTDQDTIFQEARRLIEDKTHYEKMAGINNPFGDGAAAGRIVAVLKDYIGEKNTWPWTKTVAS